MQIGVNPKTVFTMFTVFIALHVDYFQYNWKHVTFVLEKRKNVRGYV
jgi:hypothetical protein